MHHFSQKIPTNILLTVESLRLSFSNDAGKSIRGLATKKANLNPLESYNYMQKSKLPTLKFQRSLPRLPIPLLDKTCERYLLAVQPLLTPQEFTDHQRIVEEFRTHQGAELHALLKLHDQANKHTSYISEPWFDMYLRDRVPLPLNYNPLLMLKSEERIEYQNQLIRAANIVISSLRFWRSLCDGVLEPEVYHLNPAKSNNERYRRWMQLTPNWIATYASYAFKAFPLDMSQYEKLFGTTRIPQLDKDQLQLNPHSKHIIVMCRGNIYAVDVLQADGRLESKQEILKRLRVVLEMDKERKAAENGLGVLTAMERNEWAQIRQYLLSLNNNQELFQQLDSGLFCLCLDDGQDPIYDDNKPLPAFRHLLAGNGNNRWFDKSVSIIVSADGNASINFEHSWGDGVAVLRYFNEIYRETKEQPFLSIDDLRHIEQSNERLVVDANVRPLNFTIDEKMLNTIRLAQGKQMQIMDNLEMDFLRYPQLNKNTCKQHRLSPDSIIQLAFQLAIRQIKGGYVGTYESCSTAAFKHGRTETMRPCTNATKEFCETVLTKPWNARHLRVLIDQCSKHHGQLTKEAAMGQGFDRHLFALRRMAEAHNMNVSALYDSEPYRRLNHHIISTSTLSSDALMAGCFGPVVRDGLGIGYSIRTEFCGAIVTSYRNGGNCSEFIQSLEKSFDTIRRIIDESQSS